jgi:hypothetical protein
MTTKRLIKKRLIKSKNKKSQKGGYKYSDSSILDSQSKEITTISKNKNKKNILKTRKRTHQKSRR